MCDATPPASACSHDSSSSFPSPASRQDTAAFADTAAATTTMAVPELAHRRSAAPRSVVSTSPTKAPAVADDAAATMTVSPQAAPRSPPSGIAASAATVTAANDGPPEGGNPSAPSSAPSLAAGAGSRRATVASTTTTTTTATAAAPDAAAVAAPIVAVTISSASRCTTGTASALPIFVAATSNESDMPSSQLVMWSTISRIAEVVRFTIPEGEMDTPLTKERLGHFLLPFDQRVGADGARVQRLLDEIFYPIDLEESEVLRRRRLKGDNVTTLERPTFRQMLEYDLAEFPVTTRAERQCLLDLASGSSAPVVTRDEVVKALSAARHLDEAMIEDDDPVVASVFGAAHTDSLPSAVLETVALGLDDHPRRVSFPLIAARAILESSLSLASFGPHILVLVFGALLMYQLDIANAMLLWRTTRWPTTDDWSNSCPAGPNQPGCLFSSRTLEEVTTISDVSRFVTIEMIEQLWSWNTSESNAALTSYGGSWPVGALLVRVAPSHTYRPEANVTLQSCESLGLTTWVAERAIPDYFDCSAFASWMIPFNSTKEEAKSRIRNFSVNVPALINAAVILQFGLWRPLDGAVSWATVSLSLPVSGSIIPRSVVVVSRPSLSTGLTTLLGVQCAVWASDLVIGWLYRGVVGGKISQHLFRVDVLVNTVGVILLCVSRWYLGLTSLFSFDTVLNVESVPPGFDSVPVHFEQAMYCLALWVLVTVIGFSRFFVQIEGVRFVVKLIQASVREVVGLIVVFGVIYGGFLVGAMALFGRTEQTFASAFTANAFLLGFFFGGLDQETLTANHPVRGTVFFYAYSCFIVFVAVNLLIAVIMAPLDEAKRQSLVPIENILLRLETDPKFTARPVTARPAQGGHDGGCVNARHELQHTLLGASRTGGGGGGGSHHPFLTADDLRAAFSQRMTRASLARGQLGRILTALYRRLGLAIVNAASGVLIYSPMTHRWLRYYVAWSELEAFSAPWMAADSALRAADPKWQRLDCRQRKQAAAATTTSPLSTSPPPLLPPPVDVVSSFWPLLERKLVAAATMADIVRSIQPKTAAIYEKLHVREAAADDGAFGNSPFGRALLDYGIMYESSAVPLQEGRVLKVAAAHTEYQTLLDALLGEEDDVDNLEKAFFESFQQRAALGEWLEDPHGQHGRARSILMAAARDRGASLAARARSNSISYRARAASLRSLSKLREAAAAPPPNTNPSSSASSLPSSSVAKPPLPPPPPSFALTTFIRRRFRNSRWSPFALILVLSCYGVLMTNVASKDRPSSGLIRSVTQGLVEQPFAQICTDANCTSGFTHTKTFRDCGHQNDMLQYAEALLQPMLFPDLPLPFNEAEALSTTTYAVNVSDTFAVPFDMYVRRFGPVELRQLRGRVIPCKGLAKTLGEAPDIDALKLRYRGNQRAQRILSDVCYASPAERIASLAFSADPFPRPVDSLLPQAAYAWSSRCNTVSLEDAKGTLALYPCSGFYADVTNRSDLAYALNHWVDGGTNFLAITTRWVLGFDMAEFTLYFELGDGGGTAFVFSRSGVVDGLEGIPDVVIVAGVIFLVDIAVFLAYGVRYLWELLVVSKGVRSLKSEQLKPDIPYSSLLACAVISGVAIGYQNDVVGTRKQLLEVTLVFFTSWAVLHHVLFPLAEIFSRKATTVLRVLQLTFVSLLTIIPVYVVFALGFIAAGHLAWGTANPRFSTLQGSLSAIGEATLTGWGDFLGEQYAQSPFMAMVFAFSFFITVMSIIANLILSLVTSAAEDAAEDSAAAARLASVASLREGAGRIYGGPLTAGLMAAIVCHEGFFDSSLLRKLIPASWRQQHLPDERPPPMFVTENGRVPLLTECLVESVGAEQMSEVLRAEPFDTYLPTWLEPSFAGFLANEFRGFQRSMKQQHFADKWKAEKMRQQQKPTTTMSVVP